MNTQFFRFDLGVRSLLPKWRSLLNRQYIRDDLFAGVTVALVAIPLSLAIALASGVEPAVGLVTAIVAGIVCALFGGNPLAVSGPAAAMSILVAMVVARYGMAGLIVVGFVCGALQILTGVFRLGRFVRLMPLPVIEGFTAGIGAIIIIGQLPRALGLPAPDESHIVDVITHIGGLIHESHADAVLIAVGTMLLMWFVPKVSNKLPSPLIAIGAVSILAYYLAGADLALIGSIPRTLPLPTMPNFSDALADSSIFGTALLVYGLASLETLLSSTAVDKLAGARHSDLDQELIGQGLGNMAVSIFGGIPVTGVIVRSATSVVAGAKTRRAPIVHSLVLLAVIFVFAPWISKIPIAALAGLLLFIAARMMNPEKLLNLWRISRSDAIVYGVTFFVIVFVGLLEGVQWGLLAAFAVLALQVGRTQISEFASDHLDPYYFELEGPLTFLSSLKIDQLKSKVSDFDPARGVVINMKKMTEIDGTGAEMLFELLEEFNKHGVRVVLKGLKDKERAFLVKADAKGQVANMFSSSERDTLQILRGIVDLASLNRLSKGLQKYLHSKQPKYRELFSKLADGQSPHTLFITCSDSRIQPNLITSTEPGEIFIIRNIGNIVPPFHRGAICSEAAGIDYAVGVLGVREIVVCGHSGCGAMKALHGSDPLPKELHCLAAWRKETLRGDSYHKLPKSIGLDQVAHVNILHQIESLRTHPIIRVREEAGELKLSAWYFDIPTGSVEIWSPETRKYEKQSAHKPVKL